MRDWASWYNLIYLLPAVVAVCVLLVSALAGVAGDEGDADVSDLGEPGDLDADALVAEGDADESLLGDAGRHLLGFFGVGRAPLTLVLASLMLGWGLLGLAANELLRPLLGDPARFIGLSLAIAAIGSLLGAKLFAEFSARVMPKDESYAIKREGLLGLTGTVVYPVTVSAGRVHVRDRHRTLHQLSARVAPGQPLIPKGTQVIVASMDPDRHYLIVEPLGFTKGAISE
jgi:membrane protein implicated in regulation of membrane protease activity